MNEAGKGLLASLRRLLRHRQGQVGLAIAAALATAALLGPHIAPHDPLARNLARQLLPPSRDHWFGTDSLGRDLFSQVMHGARPTLAGSLGSVTLAAVAGVTLGAASGYIGGRFDLAVSVLVDLLLSFPAFLLALAVVAVLGPGLINASMAVGFSGIPVFTRLTRAEVLAIRETEYVESSRALGASSLRLVFRHILPNAAPSITVMLSLQFPAAILMLAGLSFLGLGAQPPSLEWGRLMVGARDFLTGAPWLVNLPGLVILLTVLGFNLLGNALRDVLDPRLRHVQTGGS